MSVSIAEGGAFKQLVTRAGALSADAAPTPANVDPDEIISASGAKQLAIYWDGTGVGGSTTVDLEVWVLDGWLASPAYKLIDAGPNLSAGVITILDCHGAGHFVVRVTNPLNIGSTTDVYVRAYGVPYG